MNLRAKASSGYAMAALLVAMSVMAIMLSVALPAWSHMIRREKEEELIFRGSQYARAIGLYQRKYANASPANLDALIKERFLRKKFKDPLSPNEDGEFQMLYVGSDTSARGAGGARGAGASGARAGMPNTLLAKTSGLIRGVASKNTGESIRTFKGKTHYNEWEFVAMEQTTQAGPGGGVPGQPGGPQRGGSQRGGSQRGGPQPGGPPLGGSQFGGPQRGDPQRGAPNAPFMPGGPFAPGAPGAPR